MYRAIKFIDLFSGIGGFRFAMENAADNLGYDVNCMFSSDIDKECQKSYYENFGEYPLGDISQVNAEEIPDHDVLLAGFPCQPFSIIGKGMGFQDMRGTLFFDIARILEKKRPTAFVLENVKRIVSHDHGRTMKRIMEVTAQLGYFTQYKVFNALDFGLPQKRERVFIVGFNIDATFDWPDSNVKMKELCDILETNPPRKYYASKYIKEKRSKSAEKWEVPTIWHENKSGNVSVYPYSCALRAGASYNYLLVDGERRLTPREMLRLQGFPERFKIVCSDSQTRKQAGNALPVPVAESIIKQVLRSISEHTHFVEQGEFIAYERKTNIAKG